MKNDDVTALAKVNETGKISEEYTKTTAHLCRSLLFRQGRARTTDELRDLWNEVGRHFDPVDLCEPEPFPLQ